jgi:hypothetical protein
MKVNNINSKTNEVEYLWKNGFVDMNAPTSILSNKEHNSSMEKVA